ncbi:MAG TPA: hypothetical protein VG938_03645 [Verrucomicrobiae bacterium]|jgi:hypothetical protein|nr:hypothetical protein [Verrucomicrobiae bacterium]
MKNPLATFCFAVAVAFNPGTAALAQLNSWTNSASGNWENSYWSLGQLPGTNQTVLFTNNASKTLTIAPSTVQNFPDSLSIDSITISSPINSFNTLLLNFAETQSPLTVRSVTLGSNSAITMLSSALLLDGPNGTTMQVGGEFNQNDSVVSGRQVNVGYIGPGIYNLNSGTLAVSNLWVGGAYNGVFNQNGGTNSAGITEVEGGDYILNDGYFSATIYFDSGGTFRQRGGTLNSALTIYDGNYILEGGAHIGGVTVPSDNGWFNGGGSVLQSGGTNFGNLFVGYHGIGSYTLSNGVIQGGINVDGEGSYTQWDGIQGGGGITIEGYEVFTKGGGGYVATGSFDQNGGTISCAGMDVSGAYYQNGGTNFVSGLINIYGEWSRFETSGLLCASNLTIDTVWPAFLHGTVIITNEINVEGGSPGGYSGGGDLIVSNITVSSGGIFSFGGRSIHQSGTVNLSSGSLNFAGTGAYNLGRLGSIGGTLGFYSTPCTVHFAASSETFSGALGISYWSGSLYGGGPNQIIFGTNSAALTRPQLSQIQFQNPAGLAPGNYPARILATGEIVPDTGAPLPLRINLMNNFGSGTMHLSLGGDIGQSYAIDVSTDLVHWLTWTSQWNTNGTISIDDTEAANLSQRFYRAHLMP